MFGECMSFLLWPVFILPDDDKIGGVHDSDPLGDINFFSFIVPCLLIIERTLVLDL